ncbi:MAG: hypothetical protein VKM34_10885 [Cyanobacteriota bacterium]|nr:hypothetical protein [Cyanobacteriota bacterium]
MNWEAFVLVFLAELSHALVTWLAVGADQWIGGRISEKLQYRFSGGLFLVFGLFSLKQALA